MMNKPLFCLALAVSAIAVAINIETARTFPSWFDEAFFANIAFNLANGDGLTLDLIPGYYKGEIYLYGPVYFFLQSWLVGIFGLQDFIFRLPNLLTAYLSVLLLAGVLGQNDVPRLYRALFVVAAVVDVSFNRNLVSGRMDMLAVMFVSLALYLAARQPTNSREAPYIRWLLIGGMSAVAFLTTPRALFLLPVVFALALRPLFADQTGPSRERKWADLVAAAAAFSAPVWLWIQHVGGMQAYASMFSNSGSVATHIAPSIFRSNYDNIAIGLMIVLCLLKYREVMRSTLLIGLISSFAAFSLFVKEVGPYAGMIMPFVLATIVLLIAKSSWNPLPRAAFLALITLPGLFLLGLRGIDIYLNTACRDNSKVVALVNNLIQDRARIIAPFKYYFLLEQTDRDLITLEYSKVTPELLVDKATVVIAGNASIDLAAAGFRKGAQIDCTLRRVPVLPDTFYERTTFKEGFYLR